VIQFLQDRSYFCDNKCYIGYRVRDNDIYASQYLILNMVKSIILLWYLLSFFEFDQILVFSNICHMKVYMKYCKFRL
jgi:hypothetical protein